ncbi:hypothetical protein GCM10025857_14750 [Alicyclobacillus contaminans]|uniref:hypothetical protein n=1 Tax=Alicyclobacillus contaminans TaxID=392016 RepID=UPI00041E2AB4|nr:hypothetical protein [Alicyclobacillus contaminans]GMA50118.1 hypothetical protein GCM10025857_14750 [Alicyclobacillus contaminans]
MITVSSDLLALYQNGGIFQRNMKLQVLDRNYNVLAEFMDEIFDGQITCDNSRKAVRSLDIKLTNTSGQFTWGPDKLIWLDKLFKVYYGIWVNGAWEWIPQGVFPCSLPIATSDASDNYQNEVEFSGGDKMDYLGKCTDIIVVKKGTDIATAIKAVLNGIETMFALDDTSNQQTVPYDMSWPANTDYSQIISDLAGIITWEIYYDVNGYLRLHAPIDPTTTAPLLTLSAQNSGFNIWAGAQRQCDDSNLANYIVVYGGSSQVATVSYVLQDTDPNSPTSIQRIGKRVYLHNDGNPDPVITTQDLAMYRAQYEYKKRLQVVEKLNFKMFPVPFMDIDDVYEIIDENNGTSGKYQVVSFTLPLGVDNSSYHTGYLWQVRNFAQ